MLYAIRQTTTPPSVGIAVRIGYVCGHQTRVTLADLSTPIPPERLRCKCGGRWRWVMEDAE